MTRRAGNAIAVVFAIVLWPSTNRAADAKIREETSRLVEAIGPTRRHVGLLAAVESGSLSKASRTLRLPLATVSRKVAELEAHLNATLLIRSSKGLELTPAGRSYVTAAKAILEQLTEAERAAAGEYTEPKGDLVVTAPIMFGRLHVLPVVTRFLAAYPDVSVGLVHDRSGHAFPRRSSRCRASHRPSAGQRPDRHAIRLGATCDVCQPRLSGRARCPAMPEELARHSVISFDSVSAPSTGLFDPKAPKSDPRSARGSASTPSMRRSTQGSPARG